jgi:hypothetical protein
MSCLYCSRVVLLRILSFFCGAYFFLFFIIIIYIFFFENRGLGLGICLI